MDNDRKKKIGIITVCSLILVAMVVALTVGSLDSEKKDNSDISASQKAITSICQNTDYQDACVESLKSSANDTTDPKKLIEVALEAAIKYIHQGVKNSTVLKAVQNDPKGQAALKNCHELADRAVNDLQRSYTKFNNFDVMNFNDMLSDMKIWLSGAITYQETCLDGFEGVSGEAGKKMREALTTAMQMTSNGLAMVTEISTYLESMGVQTFKNRRLLSEGDLPVLGHEDELPNWIDFNGRKLLSASPNTIRPNLVVAKDGSGKYKTINEALKDVPKESNKTFILYIKEGVYEEKVQINSSMTNLMIIGDGPTKTKITGKLNYIDGTGTYHTATVAVQGDNFIAKNIGFENSAGPEKHQAVALRVSADRAIFHNCQMDGYQDTLYVHTYRQFYRDCVISGTIDFIFGDSAAVFQGCTLVVRKPLANQRCIVTAQGRKDVRQPTGLVLQNCTFKADPGYYPVRKELKSFLGRPWKEYSRTIIMESFLDDLIQPEGWLPWNETFALNTLFYTEFNNRGPAAPKHDRVKWAGVKELPPNRIQRFTAAAFLDGNRWIQPTRVPYAPGFIFPVPKEDPNINYSPVVPEETKDLGETKEKSAAYTAPPNPTTETKTSPPAATTTTTTSGGSISTPQSEIAAAPMEFVFDADAPISYSPFLDSNSLVTDSETIIDTSVTDSSITDSSITDSSPVVISPIAISPAVSSPISDSFIAEAPALSPVSQPEESKFSFSKLFF
ncbi:hypothetical protein RD792_015871 [Penstemon davidsonii]|uniref:pectinesterase n=1 Tax=Penstemon davidsonii TaxID=160366 RepID=A0ABR0CJL4_9LAMI|nr:hypothetical protein RD792_015871 [Penstemon davidsonii]